MTLSVDITLLLPALLAGLLVSFTHVPFGQRVLQRGIIFLDLAVAQVAGLGLIVAYGAGLQPGGWLVQLIAMTAAVMGVLLLNYTEHRWPQIQEALIGSLFVIASSLSILLLATNPHGGEALKELLVGQILWVSYQQLVPVMILYGVVLSLWFGLRGRLNSLHFYLLFALTITASVQLVGVYLVFASLILPALAVRQATTFKLAYGYLVAISGYILGLLLAAILDLPAGAMIVCSLAVCAIFMAWLINMEQKRISKRVY